MSKINLLSSKIYNRIAAGEVVERPFSVVKELVENSIDAGANSITIEIENGGISLIRISDNGCGIEKNELRKALMPHATSKISSLKDLDNITSLGFRGEALASIASVSKLSIISKPSTQELGAKIYAEGGDVVGDVSDFGSSNGTMIEVSNLFYNTPVRERFLHSSRSEESEISSTISRFILGNPSISFKYIADGKVVYQSFGDGLESAFVCIYGAETINNCLCIDTEKNGIKIKGYIGKHHFTKGNRSHQTAFINGRYIVNQTIASAIANAYSPYLMKRQYPFYILSLDIPYEIVDVNVHPNKLDVRFVNNQIIYGSIYSVIQKVLDGTGEAASIIVEKENHINNTDNSSINYVKHNEFKFTKIEPKKDKLVFEDIGAKAIEARNIETEKMQNDIFAENKAYIEKLDRERQERKIIEQETLKIDREIKLVGQILNTFLVAEDGQDLYLIDQHAAHERLLFDKLNDALNNNDIVKQPLLIPFILNVNNSEFEFIKDKSSLLLSMGIDVEEFGRNAFKVSSVPAFLSNLNIQRFFDDILSELDTFKTLTLNDLLIDKIAQKACKSAIKSGDKLSELEIDSLFELLKDNLDLKCPHGRPVAVKITRTEIDKWFKRIV